MADEKTPALTLRLLTPTGTGGETACDSVRLCLRDNAEGKGGGMVGILRNHAPAVMALGKGPVRAVLGGEIVFSAAVDGGFASVMIDYSAHSFEENIEESRRVAEYAHEHGVVVEAELGTLAGVEDDVKVAFTITHDILPQLAKSTRAKNVQIVSNESVKKIQKMLI